MEASFYYLSMYINSSFPVMEPIYLIFIFFFMNESFIDK
jgi:hypothetical protein